MNGLSIRANTKSPRLISMFDRKQRLWIDSDSDQATASDSDSITVSPISINVKPSINNTDESSARNCCLICSILSSLSNINCCDKHLTLLTTSVPPAIPAQVVYMIPSSVHNWPNGECHCRSYCSKAKKRSRSSSSTSSSFSSSLLSQSRHRKKKRVVPMQSSVRIYKRELLNNTQILFIEQHPHR